MHGDLATVTVREHDHQVHVLAALVLVHVTEELLEDRTPAPMHLGAGESRLVGDLGGLVPVGSRVAGDDPSLGDVRHELQLLDAIDDVVVGHRPRGIEEADPLGMEIVLLGDVDPVLRLVLSRLGVLHVHVGGTTTNSLPVVDVPCVSPLLRDGHPDDIPSRQLGLLEPTQGCLDPRRDISATHGTGLVRGPHHVPEGLVSRLTGRKVCIERPRAASLARLCTAELAALRSPWKRDGREASLRVDHHRATSALMLLTATGALHLVLAHLVVDGLRAASEGRDVREAAGLRERVSRTIHPLQVVLERDGGPEGTLPQLVDGAALRLLVLRLDGPVDDVVHRQVPRVGIESTRPLGHAVEEEHVVALVGHHRGCLVRREALQEVRVPEEILPVGRGGLEVLHPRQLFREEMGLRTGEREEERVSTVLRELEETGEGLGDLLLTNHQLPRVGRGLVGVGEPRGDGANVDVGLSHLSLLRDRTG